MIERYRTQRRASSLVLVGTILALVSACSADVTGSSWRGFDPHRTLGDLEEVLYPVESGVDVLLGLDLAVVTLESYGVGAMADALSLSSERRAALRRSLTTRPGPGAGPDPLSGGTVASASGPVGALTLPWELAGETMTWDHRDGYVVSGRHGAPSRGVRFLLYRMDGQTGYPFRPLVRIGHIDLIDASSGSTDAVRVRAVRTAGSDRVLADYRVSLTGSGSYSEGRLTVLARGFLGEAGSVELDLWQRFDWSQSHDEDEMALEYSYRTGSRSVEVEGAAWSRYEAAEWETFDFDMEIRGGRSTTGIDARIGRNGALRGDIRSDGRRVIQIGGYDGGPVFERTDGGRLTWSDHDTLEQIWTGITDVIWWSDWIVTPTDLLVGG